MCYDLLFYSKQKNYCTLKADMGKEEKKKEMFIPPHLDMAPLEI